MIAIHPVAGAEPGIVRWVVPAGTIPVTGTVEAAPAPLEELRADGTVARIVAGDGHVDTMLGVDRTWATEGGRVRSALLAALEHPTGWRVGQHREDRPSGDDRLREAATEALAGEVGELARSHGGFIELDSVEDGVVTVRTQGACRGCPAAGFTLHARLESVLRQECPGLREVRSVAPADRHSFVAGWLQQVRRTAEGLGRTP